MNLTLAYYNGLLTALFFLQNAQSTLSVLT